MGDVTKLPKWARERIELLERDLAYEREKLSAGPEDSRVVADSYASAPRPLGDASVRFYFDEKRRRWIEARIEGDHLVVYGSDELALRPHSTNVVHVTARDPLA